MQTTQKRSHLAAIIIALVVAIATAVVVIIALDHGNSINFPLTKTHQAAQPILLQVRGLYVIYYGHLVDRNGEMTNETSKIIAAKPEIVVVPYSFPNGEPNLAPKVLQQFHEAGIKVLTYTWTKYGTRNINEVKADIHNQLSAGADGVFVDEVTNIETDNEYSYYSEIYKYIKAFDVDKLVVMNPGHYKVSERIMQISDIVSLEEEWTYHNQIPWKDKYAPMRFMGVSSNEYCDQCITDTNAVNKTLLAWSSGIGYHFSTDRYIELPSWFSSYVSQLKERSNTTIITTTTSNMTTTAVTNSNISKQT